MADPNLAACMGALAYAAKFISNLEDYTSVSSTGLLANAEVLRNDIEGRLMAQTGVVTEGMLRTAETLLSRDTCRALVDPILRQAAASSEIAYPNPFGSIQEVWEAIYDYMVANSQTINGGNNVPDTSYSAGGGNVGNAEVFVVYLDENGKKLGWITDSWTLTCTSDARTEGQSGLERWLLEGTTAKSNLDADGDGTGLTAVLRTSSADLSIPYVKNASFNTYVENGSSQLTSLSGWTQQTGANLYTNLSINTSVVARGTPGETISAALQFNGDERIEQDVVSVNNSSITQDTPYLIDLAVAKVGTPTGTIRVRVSGTSGSGGVTATLAHTAMTGSSAFDRLRITTNADCWPKSWNANNLKVQISLESSGSIDASNYFVVDDLLFHPMTRIGDYGDGRSGRGSMGIYMAVVGGTTPSVKDDVYTASDTYTARATIEWLTTEICRYGHLPDNTAGTETYADA